MGTFTMRLPDVGEGIAEAELVEWQVKLGDMVREDDIIAAVMTDKAAVEIPSLVTGEIIELGCDIGQMLPVGAVLIRIQVEGEGNETETTQKHDIEAVEKVTEEKANTSKAHDVVAAAVVDSHNSPIESPPRGKPLAAPSVRARAREENIDLRQVPGTGPAGRICHNDLNAWIALDETANLRVTSTPPSDHIEEIPVIGMRRKIAEKMSISKRNIPHITIVEEVEMTALNELREALNSKYLDKRAKLTLLPFIIQAIVEAVNEQPEFNARYDDEAQIIRQYNGVHIGIATQTPNGLNVPVIRHAQTGNLWDNASEVARLAASARDGSITLDELTGGTITITSLGSLGAIATTPIINHPEVAIVGLNKMQIRPVWDGQNFQPRKMMNISCSFDHRVIDGWDAAVFVRKIKNLLESPAMLFVER